VAVIGLTRRVNNLREERRSSLADEFYNGVKCSNSGVQTEAFGVRGQMTLQFTGRSSVVVINFFLSLIYIPYEKYNSSLKKGGRLEGIKVKT
jgi:hypothetical protein